VSVDVESILAAALRGEDISLDRLAPGDETALYDEADTHGVLPLFAERMIGAPMLRPALRDRLTAYRTQHAAADVVRERELRRMLAALDLAGVHPVLLKGAQLSYTLYDRADLRPRVDTDLLVPLNQIDAVHRTLTELGYTKPALVTGAFVLYQTAYIKFQNGGEAHIADVHWKIANPQRFADLLNFDDLVSTSRPIAALGTNARGPSDIHTLLIACIHRVVHHADSDRLIWLFDIHLLASRLGAAEWTTFLELARARGVTTICAGGLRKAAVLFGTPLPSEALSAATAESSDADRASAAYLEAGRRPVNGFLDDLRVLRNWADRRRLILEHLFPPAAYMRQVYAPTSRAPLGILYARRALRGAKKWFGRS
jgi:hypothetical protein